MYSSNDKKKRRLKDEMRIALRKKNYLKLSKVYLLHRFLDRRQSGMSAKLP